MGRAMLLDFDPRLRPAPVMAQGVKRLAPVSAKIPGLRLVFAALSDLQPAMVMASRLRVIPLFSARSSSGAVPLAFDPSRSGIVDSVIAADFVVAAFRPVVVAVAVGPDSDFVDPDSAVADSVATVDFADSVSSAEVKVMELELE